jgi:hypothetical protein
MIRVDLAVANAATTGTALRVHAARAAETCSYVNMGRCERRHRTHEVAL